MPPFYLSEPDPPRHYVCCYRLCHVLDSDLYKCTIPLVGVAIALSIRSAYQDAPHSWGTKLVQVLFATAFLLKIPYYRGKPLAQAVSVIMCCGYIVTFLIMITR